MTDSFTAELYFQVELRIWRETSLVAIHLENKTFKLLELFLLLLKLRISIWTCNLSCGKIPWMHVISCSLLKKVMVP